MSGAARPSEAGRAPLLRTRSGALIASGAGLLVAAIVGIQLGQSAISEIDPVHFQGPAERPVGAEPVAVRPAADDPFSQPYPAGWAEAPGGAGCGGDCEARRARAAAAAFAGPVATRDLTAPYWRDVTPTTELRPWRPGVIPNRGLSVERYMHYPVTQDQAEAATAPVGGARAAAPPAPALPESVAAAPAATEDPVGE